MSVKRIVSKGEKFGRLTAMKEAEPYVSPDGKRKERKIRLKCSCGTVVDVRLNTLVRGRVQSCGCYRQEVLNDIKHTKAEESGYTHRMHPAYRAMLNRCYNEKQNNYHNYGGRGITVCKRWRKGDGSKSGFWCFLEDMGERPEGYTIEREDNNGNYEPKNCVWATKKEQSRNVRTNLVVTYRGKSLSAAEALEKYGIEGLEYPAFYARLTKYKWSVGKALKTPIQAHKGKGQHEKSYRLEIQSKEKETCL